MTHKVFLGGTTNGEDWRPAFSDHFKQNPNIRLFNPVVDNWNELDIYKENVQKDYNCDIHLYIITNDMVGCYSIAEAVDSSHNKNVITIFQVIPEGFNGHELKSLDATIELIKRNGGIAFKHKDVLTSAKIIETIE